MTCSCLLSLSHRPIMMVGCVSHLIVCIDNDMLHGNQWCIGQSFIFKNAHRLIFDKFYSVLNSSNRTVQQLNLIIYILI